MPTPIHAAIRGQIHAEIIRDEPLAWSLRINKEIAGGNIRQIARHIRPCLSSIVRHVELARSKSRPNDKQRIMIERMDKHAGNIAGSAGNSRSHVRPIHAAICRDQHLRVTVGIAARRRDHDVRICASLRQSVHNIRCRNRTRESCPTASLICRAPDSARCRVERVMVGGMNDKWSSPIGRHFPRGTGSCIRPIIAARHASQQISILRRHEHHIG